MTLNSTSSFSSNFKDGKLKPGIYKIQNLYAQTYLDIHENSKEVCCRPAENLEPGKGLVCRRAVRTSDDQKWEIKRFGTGYVVQRVDPKSPEQFCTLMDGFGDGSPLCVATYPVAWRISVVKDEEYKGYEYVRFFWGTTKRAWDLEGGGKTDGRKVQSYLDRWTVPWRIWKLIPVKVEGVSVSSKSSSSKSPSSRPSSSKPSSSKPSFEGLGSGLPPPYEGVAWECEHDDFGTVVTEVTTTTTRTRYRV